MFRIFGTLWLFLLYHIIFCQKEKNEKEVADSLKDLSDDLTGLKNTLPEQSKEGEDDGK